MSKKKTPPLSALSYDASFSLDLEYFLGSDYSDISIASEELPSVIEWVNEKLQIVVEGRRVKEHDLKRAYASAYFSLKKDWDRSGYAGKPTEDALKHAITLDEEVTRLNDDAAVFEGWVSRLRGLQSTLSAKLDLVRSSEATRRGLFREPPTDLPEI